MMSRYLTSSPYMPTCIETRVTLASRAIAADWPSWRGINPTDVSSDAGLPESWSTDRENLLWKAPYGGCSTLIVIDSRVCVIRYVEPDSTKRWQEQITCLDANTGELVWDCSHNVFQTNILHHVSAG